MREAGMIANRLWLIGLAAASAVYFAVLAHWTPFGLADEGYLDYIAWRVQAGDQPFRDIELFTYAPGLFYLWAGWFHLFGVSVGTARGLGVLLGACNAALAYRAARAVGAGRLSALFAAAVILVGYPCLFRGHIPLINLAALLLALQALRSVRWRIWLAGLGALVILGAALRIDAAAAAAALTLVVILLKAEERGRQFAPAVMAGASGAAAAAAAIGGLFAYTGVLQGWLAQLAAFVPFATRRSVAWYKLPFPGFSSHLGADILPALMVSAALLSAAAAAVAWRARQKTLTDEWRCFALLAVLGAVNLPQFLIERPDADHLADHAFVFVLLAMALISAPALSAAVGGLGTRNRRLVQTGAFAALAVYAAWSATAGGSALSAAREPGRPMALSGEAVRIASTQGLPEALALLSRDLAPTEPLASLPFAPGVNFLLRRPLPSPQINFLPYNQQRANSQAQLLAGLARPALRYVFLQPPFQMGPDPRANIVCYAPQVAGVLEANFAAVAANPEVWVLRKGGRSTLPAVRCGPGPS
ncbi:hypothetical protein [Phenylobacterium sp.]|uniref:hypothetical protein n=1 Tax=Phenylobacterium sp. TaxID=1871053 RepID=UPI0035641F64